MNESPDTFGCLPSRTVWNRVTSFDDCDALGGDMGAVLIYDEPLLQRGPQDVFDRSGHPGGCLAGANGDDSVNVPQVIGSTAYLQQTTFARHGFQQPVVGVGYFQPRGNQLSNQRLGRRCGDEKRHE